MLAGACALLLAMSAACSDERSSADAEREAKVFLQADLRSGSSGEQAAELGQEYIRLDAVSGTRGDAGSKFLVFMDVSATDEETREVEERLRAEAAVESVTVVRR